MSKIDIIVTINRVGFDVVYSSKRGINMTSSIHDLRGSLPSEVMHHATDNVTWRFAEQEDSFVITAIRSIPPKTGDNVSVWMFADKSIIFTESLFYELCRKITTAIDSNILNTSLLDEICNNKYNSRTKNYKYNYSTEETYFENLSDLWIKITDIVHIQDLLVLKETIDKIYSDPAICNYSHNVVQTITDKIECNQISYNDVLDLVALDKNIFDTRSIIELIDNGTLLITDLLKCGVPKNVIKSILTSQENIFRQCISYGEFEHSLDKPAMDIYVWGMPGAGKSSFLGTLLSYLSSGEDYPSITIDHGGESMSAYLNFFHPQNSVCTFPPLGRPVGIPVMNISLFEERLSKTSKSHSLTFIETKSDFLDWLFRMKVQLQCDNHMDELFGKLLQYLSDSENRNIHILCLPADSTNININGVSYNDYLRNLFDELQLSGCMKRCVTFIVLLTKYDTFTSNVVHTSAKDEFEKFYPGLSSQVTKLCNDYNVTLTVQPYSVGDCYFKNLFVLDTNYARNLINLILSHLSTEPPEGPLWWCRLFNLIKS